VLVAAYFSLDSNNNCKHSLLYSALLPNKTEWQAAHLCFIPVQHALSQANKELVHDRVGHLLRHIQLLRACRCAAHIHIQRLLDFCTQDWHEGPANAESTEDKDGGCLTSAHKMGVQGLLSLQTKIENTKIEAV
jgi:hypothetical protein